MYLKRYHDVEISSSGVWRILKKLQMNRLPSSQRYKRLDKRWQRYEKQQPGHRVQIDVKFVSPIRGARKKYYQFTAIDDCTRLRVLRIYDRLNQKTAIQFVDYVLERLPFSVQVIQTDNGGEFQTSFHWHVLDKGIGHVYIKPRQPRLNGKVERSHRIDEEEFYRLLDGVLIDDAEIFNNKLQEWETFYNYHRLHGGLQGQTPYERLRQKTISSVSRQHQSHTLRFPGTSRNLAQPRGDFGARLREVGGSSQDFRTPTGPRAPPRTPKELLGVVEELIKDSTTKSVQNGIQLSPYISWLASLLPRN